MVCKLYLNEAPLITTILYWYLMLNHFNRLHLTTHAFEFILLRSKGKFKGVVTGACIPKPRMSTLKQLRPQTKYLD